MKLVSPSWSADSCIRTLTAPASPVFPTILNPFTSYVKSGCWLGCTSSGSSFDHRTSPAMHRLTRLRARPTMLHDKLG